jgi:F0F1-type ATP synthase alpha subunit
VTTATHDIARELAATLREQIEGFEPSVETVDVGTVIEVGDGIARASGLANAKPHAPIAVWAGRQPITER